MTTRPIAIVTVGSRSDVGRERDQNQDSLMCFMPATASGLPSRQGWLFAVADGMGGYAAGEVASQIAVETIVQHYAASDVEDLAGVLQQGISSANEAVRRRGQELGVEIMGTTVVCAAVRDDQLYIAHVGDSRAYLLRGETLKPLTRDHSLVSEQVRQGLLTEAEALESDLRGIVTRALGMKSRVQADIAGPLTLSPDDVVLLCSDGVCGYVPEDQMRYILQTHRPDPQAAANLLIEAANAAGGFDNATAIVLRVVTIEQAPLDFEEHTAPTAARAAGAQTQGDQSLTGRNESRSNAETIAVPTSAESAPESLENTSERLPTLPRKPGWLLPLSWRELLPAIILMIVLVSEAVVFALSVGRNNSSPTPTPEAPALANAPTIALPTQTKLPATFTEYTLSIVPQAPLITFTHFSTVTVRAPTGAQGDAPVHLTVTFRTNATIIEPNLFETLIDLSGAERIVRVELAPQVNFNRQEQVKIEALAEADSGSDPAPDAATDQSGGINAWTVGTFGLPSSPGLRMRSRLTTLVTLAPTTPARSQPLPVRLFIRWQGTGAIPGDFKPEAPQTQ